jgi:hypothetical protein
MGGPFCAAYSHLTGDMAEAEEALAARIDGRRDVVMRSRASLSPRTLGGLCLCFI